MNIDWQTIDSTKQGYAGAAEAVADLRDLDGRPLLIMREVLAIEGKADEKLAAALKNERVSLASKWFQCVKVRGDVRDNSHQYHELFGTRPPVAVVASWDGGKIMPVRKPTSSALWRAMETVARRAYAKSPATAAKQWQKLLSQFDALDDKAETLEQQLADSEAKGKKGKVKALRAKLAKLGIEREKAFAKEQPLRELPLKPRKPAEEEE